MIRIKDIIIYPVKGLAGISLDECLALEKGLEHDRRFMLVEPDGKFISQREYPQLALFKTGIQGEHLQVSFRDSTIKISLRKKETKLQKVTVWEHSVEAYQSDPAIDEWFTNHLGKACHMVYMNERNSRVKILKKSPDTTEVSFADGYPYLFLGTESMELLNQKMGLDYKIDRFRANIILETVEAHIEDTLDHVSFAGTPFRMIKPCARCQVTTIDQLTGEKGKEPLKTLATYRTKDQKIYFGMNAVCLKEGKISVGDTLESS